MQTRLFMIILLFLVGITVYSQEIDVTVQNDTIGLDETVISPPIISPAVYSLIYGPNPLYSSLSLSDQRLEISPYFFDQSAVMPQIPNLGGYVISISLPGLMGIESGSLSYTLSSDHISFTPSVYVNKYGYYGGLTTSLGVGGELSYSVNDRFSITAFGSYYNKSWSANPAVMSNMQSSRFGGYGTWSINERWSLSAGVQRVQNSATNQWQTVPIIIPTYKIIDQVSIGVDIGGVLYQILESQLSKRYYGRGNPTIGPPIKPQIDIPPFKP